MADPAERFQAALAARAQMGARRIGLSIASALAMAVALGFLSVALWIVIADAQSTEVAALVLGGLYLVAALILRMAARSPKAAVHPVRPEAAPTEPPVKTAAAYPPLAEAFVFGLDTALRLRRSRRD